MGKEQEIAEGALRARIEELEGDLRAQAKTIDVLMARIEGTLRNRSAAFGLFEQNITLERLVAERTRELSSQGEALRRALADLQRAQVQLVHAQKLEAIGSLAAGVAHEINTPAQYASDNVAFLERAFTHLGNVAAAAVLVAESAPAGSEPCAALVAVVKKARLGFVLPQVPRALEQAREGLSRIAAIVGAMKEFSHPSSQNKEPVELGPAIHTTLTVARNEWKYVAEIDTRFDPDLPPVPALRDELNQVILNLVVNAAHAIAEAVKDEPGRKGIIGVSTRREADWAIIEVSDTGTGIPEKIRDRIFDPFFTTKPVGKGTGQGLAIAYSVVVDRHGGRIEVQSELGKGSTFVVRLPLGPPRVGAQAGAHA